MTTTLRAFYRKSDSKIVWTSSLEGTGKFPRTVQEELTALPDIKIGATRTSVGTSLGGVPENFLCLEVTDALIIVAFIASDTNTIVGGELVVGMPRPLSPPPPDYKAQWLAAATVTDKISVLAKVLGLA